MIALAGGSPEGRTPQRLRERSSLALHYSGNSIPPESPHARQLARGFPGLKFEPPLESEFREVHHARVAPLVRRSLWLAIAFVACFSSLNYFTGLVEWSAGAQLARVLPFLSMLACALVVVSTRWYRFYPLLAQVGAPMFGTGVVILNIAAGPGVNLVSTVVITTIYVYLMLGLRFHQALRSGLLILGAHVVVALAAGVPLGYQLTTAAMLVFANFVGAAVCYNLELANRTSFLEARLLTEVASRDGLTGIYNRRLLDDHLDRVWQQATRNRVALALLLVDIDHFKAYNDYYGHQAGDECLKLVAAAIARCARRPLDVAARYGGEEFAMVLYDADRDYVEEAARRIQAAIEALAIRHLASPAPGKRLTVSIGGASVQPRADRSRFGLVQLADEALYEAKERGRNRLVIMDKEYADLSTGTFRKSAAAS